MSPTPAVPSVALRFSVAPFRIGLVNLRPDDGATTALAEELYARLHAVGVEVLMDDRDERAGVKFKDADLVGIPYRINIGRGVAEGKVEFVDRLQNQSNDIALNEIAGHVTTRITSALRTSLPAAVK